MSFCELSVEKLDEKMLQFQMGMDSSCLFNTIVHTYICAMGGKFETLYECMYQLLKANLLKNKKMGVNASSKS